MGSFNVSCGLSNLTINPEDPVVFIPLSKNKLSDSDEFGNFFVYPNSRYGQCLPPLLGHYYDYGYLTDIQESMGASLVRDKFHITPEEFIKCIGNSGRSIYSSIGPIAEHFPNTLPKDYYLGGDKMEKARHLLSAVGFQEPHPGVFTWARKGEETPMAAISISGEEAENWRVAALDDEGEVKWSREYSSFTQGTEHTLEEASKFLGILPGFQEKHWWAVKKLRSMSGMFIHGDVYEQMMSKPLPEEDYWVNRMEEVLNTTEKKFQEIDAMEDSDGGVTRATAYMMASWSLDGIKEHLALPPEVGFAEMRKRGNASESIMEMIRLYHVMQATNRMFTPGIDSGYYAQEEVMEQLSNLTLGIIQKRRDEMEEWEE